ncbi:DMT family transporter [Bosea sp. ANAM02]|uniref:DMT family transporter n=1 Tax=Bosea sp. ANAM02 TaxID=2020412 RepID=UPI00140ED7B6|nr:DMT family transporter [Bosea sp. ANAM02]BCB17358.1 hypothetical protein OCUBac02_02520 [Bosea sp. ANAM02]
MSEERQSGRQGRPGFEGDAPWHEPAASAPPEPGLARPVPIVEPEPPGGPGPGRIGWLETRRQRLRYWWRGASPNLRGSVFMVSAMLVYAVMVAGIKHVGQGIPLVQILLIRQVIMTAILLLFAAGSLRLALHTDRLGLQIFRSVVTLLSMLCGFTAIVKIPLAQATAIGFSQVLFVTIAAVLFLKEVVDGRRWAATVIGFVGVLIMLRPSSEGLDIYALLAVAGAICGAAITVSVRKLAASERTDTILLYQGHGADRAIGRADLALVAAADARSMVLADHAQPVRHGRAVADHPRLSGWRGGGAGAARFQPPAAGELHRLRLLRRDSQADDLDRCRHRHRRDALYDPQERSCQRAAGGRSLSGNRLGIAPAPSPTL